MTAGGSGGPEGGGGLLEAFHIDVGHQEMARIVGELEEVYRSQPDAAALLPLEAVQNQLMSNLGYEDVDELEDALKGPFKDFVEALPHVVLEQEEGGRWMLRVKPDPPEETWVPKRYTYRITQPEDLWTVCLRSPHGSVEIPEIEFEIGCDSKRVIDTIYNQMGAAIYNLGRYANESQGLGPGVKDKILDTVITLNQLLDVEKDGRPFPWTWIVHDRSGLSEFKPGPGSSADVEIMIGTMLSPEEQAANPDAPLF